MKWRSVWTIFRKEMLDTVRDKRTLMMMIGMPIILYPALMLLGSQVALVQQARLDEKASKVAVAGEGHAQLTSWLQDAEKIELVPSSAAGDALVAGEIDAYVNLAAPETILESGGTVPVHIYYDSTEPASRDARNRVEDALTEVFETLQSERLESIGLSQEFIRPLAFELEDVVTPEKATGSLLGMILPMIMVLMIALGAFYPAVDLTAGEKERGTFESLLSTPTSKLEIVTGKFITVFLLAMLSGVLNLASMGLTLAFLAMQYADVTEAVGIAVSVPYRAFFIVLLVLIPLGFFISAAMMAIAVLARSFKEAQNYVTPVFLLIMMPALVAGLPGTRLTFAGQFVPVYNVVLLFRELMTGKAGWDAFFAVFISTAVFAVLALQFAAWLFQREEVILSEERGIPLTVRRSELRPREMPTAGLALALFLLLLMGLFYGATWLQQWRLLPGLLITEWGILLLGTVGFLWFFRINLRQTLSLRLPRPGGLLGSVLCAGGAMLLLIQVQSWHQRVLPMPPEFAEELERLFSGNESTGGLLWLLFVIALSPAICEEVVFRGALLSGLRQRLSGPAVIVVVGLLFGVFHLSVFKLLPTALLGALLTYLVYRGGSIVYSMVAHSINNGIAVLLATGRLPISEEVLQRVDVDGLPLWLNALAAVVFLCGIALVEWSGRRNRFGGVHDA